MEGDLESDSAPQPAEMPEGYVIERSGHYQGRPLMKITPTAGGSTEPLTFIFWFDNQWHAGIDTHKKVKDQRDTDRIEEWLQTNYPTG